MRLFTLSYQTLEENYYYYYQTSHYNLQIFEIVWFLEKKLIEPKF